jgi:hypothetical protein
MATQNPNDKQAAREARIQRILRQVEEQLRQSLPEPEQPLEKTEQQIVEVGREIREVIERETLAPLDGGYQGSHAACSCGRDARYVGESSRQLVTLNGVHRLRRAYYHCAWCQRGFCPLDRLLGIGARQSSVGVCALVARFASYLPFEKAAEELEITTGVRLSARTLEREALAVGETLTKQWRTREEQLWAGRSQAPSARPAQLQITCDGVMVLVGKEWREAKVGTVYQTREDGGVASATYTASLGNSVLFGRRLRTLAYGAGVSYCRKVGVVGDGADWIWQEAAKHFPQTVEILDFYHAVEHLWEVARARFGEGDASEEWITQQKEALLEDRVGEVIAAVESWETRGEGQAEVKRRVGNYLRTHTHRMRYKTFREAGYHIGSGVAEASCKSVVQARLKGTGMRWSEAGAEAMLQMRAAWCSTGRTNFLGAARQAVAASGS